MTAADLVDRLNRLYAAVGGVFETDPSLFEPKVVEDESGTCIVQDLAGGLTQAQLENLLLQFIHAMANLRDNVAKCAPSSPRTPSPRCIEDGTPPHATRESKTKPDIRTRIRLVNGAAQFNSGIVPGRLSDRVL